jgi:hypothetical protein
MTAAEVATDVLVLLRRGRVAPALAQLERLPGLIQAEVDAAYEQGRLDLAREITGDAKATRARAPQRHEWLAERIRVPELRERAKAVLRLNDELLDAIAEGGVGLGSSSWRKLREALGR